MWDLEFGIIELARANGHGRSQLRREERLRCDAPVTVFRERGVVSSGFCLDRSATGVRVILDDCCVYTVGEHVTVDLGDASVAFRVVWSYAEDDACVLGLERAVTVSGEYPVLPYFDDTLISCAS